MRFTYKVNNKMVEKNIPGRDAQCLALLIMAAEKGMTQMELINKRGGTRISAYIHRLRHNHGIKILTIDEMIDGAYPTKIARYKLMQRVNHV